MSLLLEALKKAEKAKEDAQRRAGESGEGAAAPSAFDPDSTVLDDGRQVTTRDQLPDISSPLEILSEDLRPAATPAGAAARELSIVDERQPVREPKAPRREPARGPQGASPANAERATAQRVFEAKFKEPNPRLPFFITMGLLGLFAVGTVTYFWMQLRPPPSLVNANPPRASNERPADVAAKPGPADTAAAPATPGLPGLPAGTQAPAAAPAANVAVPGAPAAAQPAAAAPAAPATSAAAPAAAAGPTPARPVSRSAAQARAEERAVTVNRSTPQINPQVAAGYAAYQSGDLAKARGEYQQALRDEPGNRDALLGLAAVEMRSQHYDLADGYYRRILQADPRDAHAQAGTVALRAQQLDPVAVESRMKSMLAGDRDANVLYFTLGNQLAQQGRWAEAQQAYFKAFASDPENPDFAFNLAVSLDQLHQPQLALEYYRRALVLAEKRNASFAADGARTRVQQLSR